MSAWSAQAADRLAERGRPRLAAALIRTPGEVVLAIGVVGAVFAVAARSGARTGGRSRLFQLALTGYEAHAWSHFAASIAWRGYTPGVGTALPLVAGWSKLARGELRRTGVTTSAPAGAVAAFGLLVPAAHLLSGPLASSLARGYRRVGPGTGGRSASRPHAAQAG